MAYTFKRITYPIKKKDFSDFGAAFDKYINDDNFTGSFDEWMKKKGHSIKNHSLYSKAAQQAKQSDVALKKLRSYLNASEPEMVYFLVNTWNSQGKAITYKELRAALLQGDIDQAYLQQWHEDYSKFVTEHLEPAWIDAMTAANAEKAAKYPEWNFDPYADGVKKWCETKAADFVTNVTATQIMGLRAVVQRAAVLEDLSVDQLSRAIRPMVGLTHQQTVANLNYYENLIKNGTSEAKALDLSIRYSARQHRFRAYNIARTELAFAYNQGSYEGTKQAQEAGYMGEVVKIWCTADDERVCEICGGLDGKQIAMDEDFDFTTKLATPANPTIRRVPPAHPSCRCTVMYEEISPPIYKPTENPDKLEDAASEKDDGPAAAIPEEYQLPDGLTYQGPSHMGGTGKSYIYKDADGQEWIFKPGKNKDGTLAPYRTYVTEAAYKVQSIVDPDTAVPVARFTDVKGTFGAMQKKIDGSNISSELYKLYQGQDLPADLKSQIQREHVTDWLIGNFDGHSKEFIADTSGRLVGLDKDQAFRYLQDKASRTMSYSYHPNAVYGEDEPIYNAMYRMFAKGDIDLEPNDVLPYIKRVESISDKEYREIFREYAENLNGKGKAAEALLDDIVERKASLRETYRTFYEELLTERTGKKVAFKFADEGAQAAKQALTAQTMTKEAAMKLSTADLKKMAKDKNIAWFSDMTKDQLATCISDPTQISTVHEQVKAKVAERAARRAAAKVKKPATTPKGTFKVTNGVYEAGEVFDDFSAIPQDRKLGISLASDSTSVEGLNLSARRVRINGEDCIEISGKLTETATDELADLLKGEQRGMVVFGKGPLTAGKVDLDDAKRITSARGVILNDNGITMELVTDKDQRALMGTFRLRMKDTGDAIADAAKAKTALKNSRFSFIVDTPTAKDEEIMKKARLLFQQNPKAALELNKIADKAGAIDGLLAANGIDPADIKNMVKKEVYPGFFTFVNEGAHKTYQKAGLEYIWSGVGSQDSVVAMVKAGGHASSMSRIRTGFMGDGASVISDIESGGADNVFTRVATKLSRKEGKRYSDSFAGGSYQVLIKPSVTDRTDWYAFHGDRFGSTKEHDMESRPGALDFFKSENSRFVRNNELMFRHGISITDWLGIDCRTQTHKDRLISALKSEGITQINGKPLEQFIRVNEIIGAPLK